MKKIKVTKGQFDRLLSEDIGVKGGINRVDKNFKKEINSANIQKLGEAPFDIKASVQGIPNSKMTNKKPVSMPEPIQEDIFSPEFHQAIHHFIENIWLNPSQKGLDKVFVDNGITWGDIITYLTGIGVLAGVGNGVYKVVNYFKRKFTGDKNLDMRQKQADIEKITKMVEKDPESPWQKKIRLQGNQDSGYETKTRTFNPKNRKAVSSYPHPSMLKNNEMDEVKKPIQKLFKPIAMNYEIAVLKGPDGMYIFYYEDIDRDEFGNTEYELNVDDLADYVNRNINKLTKGEGLAAWETATELIKIDEPLREKLILLYNKDKNLVKALQNLEEMTGTASAGAFTGPLGGTQNQNITKDYTPAKQIEEEVAIEEVTAAGGGTPSQVSSTTGQYTQPAIWANGKKNWKASKKTQYPHGEMVDFDSCTKLNNNKSAQKGKCSTGAADNVVKTHRTKQSVISKTVYEEVAKRTGKTIEEVQKIIETKLTNNKSLA